MWLYRASHIILRFVLHRITEDGIVPPLASIATKFEMDALDTVRTCTHNMLATLRASCDGHHVDATVGGERLSYTRTTGNNIEDTREASQLPGQSHPA